jgi:hypothetical protein
MKQLKMENGSINVNKWTILNTVLFIVTVLVTIAPAFSNGYPLLFPDSGTYLASGHTGNVPIDRPIIYGLLVRHLSLSYSTWLVILSQSIIYNYLVFMVVKKLVQPKKPFVVLFIIGILMSIFTGVGYYTSLVIADIFTVISILSLFLLVVLDKKEKVHIGFISIILLVSILTHLSHIPLVLAQLFILGIYFLIKKQFKAHLKRFVFIVSLFGGSLLTIALVNNSFGVGFVISRTNNIILAARYIESGLASKFLQKNCGNSDFYPSYNSLCEYKDVFDTWPDAGTYLYDSSSPIYDEECLQKGNWTNCWIEKDAEYGDLISDILSDDELRTDFIALAITGTLKQLITIEQSPLNYVDLRGIVEKYFPDDLYAFDHSRQARDGSVTFHFKTILEVLFLYISILLIVLFIRNKKLTNNTLLFLIAIGFSLLFNAAFCATLSNVIPRYQGRIVFLIPLYMFVLLFQFLNDKKFTLKF